jgi:hypothetical protein
MTRLRQAHRRFPPRPGANFDDEPNVVHKAGDSRSRCRAPKVPRKNSPTNVSLREAGVHRPQILPDSLSFGRYAFASRATLGLADHRPHATMCTRLARERAGTMFHELKRRQET